MQTSYWSVILFLQANAQKKNQVIRKFIHEWSLHRSINNEGHHDVHVSYVLLQVWVRQVQLFAPVTNKKGCYQCVKSEERQLLKLKMKKDLSKASYFSIMSLVV